MECGMNTRNRQTMKLKLIWHTIVWRRDIYIYMNTCNNMIDCTDTHRIGQPHYNIPYNVNWIRWLYQTKTAFGGFSFSCNNIICAQGERVGSWGQRGFKPVPVWLKRKLIHENKRELQVAPREPASSTDEMKIVIQWWVIWLLSFFFSLLDTVWNLRAAIQSSTSISCQRRWLQAGRRWRGPACLQPWPQGLWGYTDSHCLLS